jgi:hypothetical protein
VTATGKAWRRVVSGGRGDARPVTGATSSVAHERERKRAQAQRLQARTGTGGTGGAWMVGAVATGGGCGGRWGAIPSISQKVNSDNNENMEGVPIKLSHKIN